MMEFLLEYSERSVMGVRFGSRETALPDLDRLTADGGPKYPPSEYSYKGWLALALATVYEEEEAWWECGFCEAGAE